jgi:hypothetical protein
MILGAAEDGRDLASGTITVVTISPVQGNATTCLLLLQIPQIPESDGAIRRKKNLFWQAMVDGGAVNA